MATRLVVFVVCWFTLLLSQAIAQVQAGNRMMMHSFQEGSNLVFVAIRDLPSGPKGIVASREPVRKERSFTVPKAEFEKMWSTLMSSGAEKYLRDATTNRVFDAVNFYVFSAGQNANTNYAIPTSKASAALVALAKQFRAYAK